MSATTFFKLVFHDGGGPMKKWHMEGIVKADNSYGRRLIVPDEGQMYARIRQYRSSVSQECLLVATIRNIAGWFLRLI